MAGPLTGMAGPKHRIAKVTIRKPKKYVEDSVTIAAADASASAALGKDWSPFARIEHTTTAHKCFLP